MQDMAQWSSRRRHQEFTLLGFPIELRRGFVLFLLLIVFIYGGTLGLWTAGAIGAFTILHELGHALAARAYGADARISLDFLVAYAAYQPRRPLQWYERAVIAVSGPALQISVGTAILLLGGINPLNRFDIGTSDASVAIWWASVALGILNLLPVLPLDGGAIVLSAVERLFPRRGQIAMIRFSLLATTASAFFLIFTSNLRGFLPFIVFLLIYQVQALRPKPQTSLQQLKPSGDFLRDSLVTGSLVDDKRIDVAISYGSESFALCPFSDTAVNVARALVLRGDPEGAVKWLQAAKNASIDFATLLEKINTAYELQELHGVAEFDSLHAELLLLVQSQRL
ncbi:MAG: hypothetical protein EXQ64_03400 [Ilumatobacteraceae bacterium]|nr:hypothetical protein [Ilumatobacteraceae bacterium]